MKEEEAKSKMCPNLYHASVVMAFKLKEDSDIEKAMRLSLCQGSDCMMWQWSIEENKVHSETSGFKPEDYQGYCGLSK